MFPSAPIFQQYNYFRQNLEEKSLSLSIFISFTSNFLCKILLDNKNIDANIWIFQIPFSQWRGGLLKKLFWGFFWQWSHLSLPKISTFTDPPFTFFAHISLIFDKYQMAIFFIEYLGSLRPVITSLMCIWSKLSKN